MLKDVRNLHRVLFILVVVCPIALVFLMSRGVMAANTANINSNVTIKPSLTLDIPTNTITMNLNPSTHDFDEKDLTVRVGTNNFTGFKLYVTTLNNNTNLVNTLNDTKVIPNLTTSTSVASFPVNNWGYRLTQNATSSSGNYGAFPTTSPSNIVMQSSGPVNEKIATLGFGAKIDYTKPSGLYQLDLDFKAIPITTTEYMQNLDPAICTTDPTVVIDQRDEHAYLIQRLDDGKCWMLDNLDLDLTSDNVINILSTANTNADSASLTSLKSGNRAAGDRYATVGLDRKNWNNDPLLSYSQPLVNRSGSCSTEETADPYTVYPCTYNGNYTHNDVLSTLTPAVSNFGEGTGKIGTYYNICAASAGNFCYGDGQDAYGSPPAGAKLEYDICPAGWRLPTGGSGGEFNNLCNAIKGSACDTAEYATPTDSSSMQYKFSAVLSGYFHSGHAGRQGTYGAYISSTPGTDPSRVYYARFHAAGVRMVSDGDNRRGGFAIRCVLK